MINQQGLIKDDFLYSACNTFIAKQNNDFKYQQAVNQNVMNDCVTFMKMFDEVMVQIEQNKKKRIVPDRW